MYRIKTLNKISSAGLDLLDQTRFQVGGEVENEDGVLVRSAPMHDYVFPEELRAIARAGAGTNNIPIDRCSENGIVVFNTPGANANAVKELVLAALLIASRDILGGAEWVQEQVHTPGVDLTAVVEKGKSAFAGPELYRKTLGVIGLGAIGALVCNIALELGMDVYGYDPFLSVEAALRLDRHVHVVKNVDELYRASDYITIHIPYNNSTKDFINAESIAKMKGQVRILNLARGGLVNDDDMIQALERSGRFRAPGTFDDLHKLIHGYLGDGNKMGEGWLLTAEMLELIHSGTNNIVCTQPFGCLPNHIVGKGMIRKLKDDYPTSNIVAIDYDPSATKINQENRIKLMLANAKGLSHQESAAPRAAAQEGSRTLTHAGAHA